MSVRVCLIRRATHNKLLKTHKKFLDAKVLLLSRYSLLGAFDFRSRLCSKQTVKRKGLFRSARDFTMITNHISHDVERLARLCLALSAINAQGRPVSDVNARLQVEMAAVGIHHGVGFLDHNSTQQQQVTRKWMPVFFANTTVEHARLTARLRLFASVSIFIQGRLFCLSSFVVWVYHAMREFLVLRVRRSGLTYYFAVRVLLVRRWPFSK